MKKVISLLCSVAVAGALCAAPRTAEEAATIAADFTNAQPQLRKAHKAARTASNMRLAHTATKINSTEAAYYVFNQEDNAGCVFVSADDQTMDVLGYTENGQFDYEKANPNLKWWLNRYAQEISNVNEENAYTADMKRKATKVTAIANLLTDANGKEITWYQETPYWNNCPMDLWKTSERCLTGCVATAASQIMYHWRWPAQGTGSHSYTWQCCTNSRCTQTSSKTLSMDFSTITFDWDNMVPSYGSVSYTTAQANAVATLMSACGIACDMAYGGSTIGGSGAWTDDMGYGMITYFGYTYESFITTYSKSNYESAKGTSIPVDNCVWSATTSTMTTAFNGDLEAGRPILMGGEDNSNGGHEFVCAGRDSNNKFYINWGWEGEDNGYFTLSSLSPSSYSFSDEVDAMIGIQPANIDTVHVTGVSVNPTSAEIKIKGSVNIVATVAPSDATVKAVTWSSSNTAVATVDATGKVKGIAAGNAVITATTKEGGYKATCNITVLNQESPIEDCDDYTHAFEKGEVATGSNTWSDYTWEVTMEAGSINWDAQNDRGIQFGSKNTPAKSVSIVTENTADCLIDEVVVNAAMGSKGDATLEVYVGGTKIGDTQSLTSSAADYTFANTDDVQGNVEIRYSNSSKAMYIKSINITMQGSAPTAVEEVEVTPATNVRKVIEDKQVVIIRDGVRYNVLGQQIQ